MKFLVDNQLPAALARWLMSRGCDCVHVSEAGLASASDDEIWAFACETQRAVVSKDEDFLFHVYREPSKTAFIWVRLGNCRTRPLLFAFDQLWPKIEESLQAGERVIEVR